jgi:hypothetical protein
MRQNIAGFNGIVHQGISSILMADTPPPQPQPQARPLQGFSTCMAALWLRVTRQGRSPAVFRMQRIGPTTVLLRRDGAKKSAALFTK